MGWADIRTAKVYNLPPLPYGAYTYRIEQVDRHENDSVHVKFNVEGRTIVSRLYYDGNLERLLISCGQIKEGNQYLPYMVTNAVGKSGRCIVDQWNGDAGKINNKIVAYLFPDNTDEKRSVWSVKVKIDAGWKCSSCGSNRNLEAHHIKPVNLFPELKYDIRNGQCLCRSCHTEWHRIHGWAESGGPGL